MAREIERKFLLASDEWRAEADAGAGMRQGYLAAEAERSVRVRIVAGRATMTIKGAAEGLVRLEFEYAIPLADAAEMLDRLALRPCIEKTRFLVPCGGHVWEIDVFEGDNAGLIVAEIELNEPDEAFDRPSWLGDEVTDDPRYLNASLARHPYSCW
ncbi:MAG: CYTH domain-containing protein [Pseudomonadota bacterium]